VHALYGAVQAQVVYCKQPPTRCSVPGPFNAHKIGPINLELAAFYSMLLRAATGDSEARTAWQGCMPPASTQLSAAFTTAGSARPALPPSMSHMVGPLPLAPQQQCMPRSARPSELPGLQSGRHRNHWRGKPSMGICKGASYGPLGPF
jgi:hypothetical protein